MNFLFHRSYRGPLQGVILDWAGTTLDYGCYAPAVVFVEVFNRRNVPISVAEARVPMGAHKKVHIRKISQLDAVAERWQSVHGRPPTEADIEAMFQDFIPLQLDCLANYADLIPGTLETIKAIRARNLKIGSTTGYTGEMMTLLLEQAKRRGYEPDSTVCATDVPAGRPEPWMCLQNAMRLGIYPMESLVKIGDTLPDIEEGLNAGMWTVGLAKTGNEMGLNEAEIQKLTPESLSTRLANARHRMRQTGAHFVMDGIWDLLPVLDEINARLAHGERP